MLSIWKNTKNPWLFSKDLVKIGFRYWPDVPFSCLLIPSYCVMHPQPIPKPREFLGVPYCGGFHQWEQGSSTWVCKLLHGRALVSPNRSRSNALSNVIREEVYELFELEWKTVMTTFITSVTLDLLGLYISLWNNSDLYKLLLAAIYIHVKMPPDIWRILFASNWMPV